MAQIGTIKLQTQNSGVVDVPVFDTGDSGSSIYEFVRVETASGTGFIPVTDPADATYPFLRVQSQNQGVVAVTDTASVIPDSALAQDLIAWWRFEDGDARDYTNDLDATFADSTAYDGTVNGATYLSSGGVTDFESGANSGAFEFGGDAAGDFIDIPDLDAISTPLTICGWFKINNKESEHAIALNIFESDELYPLVFDDPPVFRTIFNPGPTLTSASFNLNEWYFHASTIDSNGAEIYLGRNGTVTLEDSGGGASATYNGPYKIGGRSDLDPSKYANADIEDNRLYDRVLSQSELQSIYDDTKPQ